MSTSDSLSQTSSHSSSKSHMKIDMPPPPSTFIHRSPAYIIASTPSPTQNPTNASWHPQGHHHHHIHIATPHPLAATAQFLDHHVPLFAKHHAEFATGRDLRAAKREAARHSGVESAIPEVDVEHLPGAGGAVEAAIQAATVTGAAPAMADARDFDASAAWNAVLAQREAARLRSGSDMSRSEERWREHSDSDSIAAASPGAKNSGSPAVTP